MVANAKQSPEAKSSEASALQADEAADCVTQNNLSVVAMSPAMGSTSMYQAAGHATGLMFENAVMMQNNSFNTMLAGCSVNVKKMQGKLDGKNTLIDLLAIARQLGE